ncbi:FAD-binding protein [Helicobacter cholecystus]|uniref:FAD-binding protein n=1 Tax=Helicobacter cholecystus TaxID=45498 RepID=A0A3D8IVG3_9HELI|nr:FAD-linked oxidase C-terminal domain-containing protein [Helicobacter cholecystus]RDU68966.1 FAD-binding protein [Helicobacter cholecystus]VEJ26007.1 FAD linked oxidase-like protein [Helicobacter cholecystus]
MILSCSDLKFFKHLLGEENVCNDPAVLSVYSYDSTRLEYLPSCVLFPRHTQDIQEIMKYACIHKLPIIPRGAGSGMSGGSLGKGIILAMQKHFRKIIEIDSLNLCAKVQPCVINAELNLALNPYGLFFPPDPASASFSTIGGNMAENAGGMCAVKYGVSKDYLLSAEVVLGNGEKITLGHKTYKDVAGYNLLGLLCGSEGTLGIFTELTLKLKAKPKFQRSLLICFDDISKLAQCSYTILSEGITPCAMEFLDKLSTQALNALKPIYPPHSEAILIIKLDGNFAPSLEHELQAIIDIAKKFSPLLFKVAQTPQEEEEIWFGRKNASQANSIYGVKKLNEDITLPRSCVPEFLTQTQKIGEKYNLKIPCFGHIGDGNIHTNVFLPSLDLLPIGKKAIDELFSFALSLGGTLSGEHGIGITKASYMPLAFSQAHLQLFKEIKKAFDPYHILNPYKMGLE